MSLTQPRLSRSRQRYRAALQRIELLESRTLMSVVPVVNTIPGLQGQSGVYDVSGHLWVFGTDASGNSVFQQVDPVNGTVQDSINLSNFGVNPNGSTYVVGKNDLEGHIYVPDAISNGIDDIDIVHHTAQVAPIGNDSSDAPWYITGAPDGSVWYLSMANVIGRWDPVSQTVDANQFAPSSGFTDPLGFSIVTVSNNEAWVAMGISTDDPEPGVAHNYQQLAYVTLSNQTFTASIKPLNLDNGDINTQENNYIGNMVSDGSGGVWFPLSSTLTNQPHTFPQGPDTFVHAYFSGNTVVQHAVPINDGATGASGPFEGNPGDVTDLVNNLALDSSGKLWFSEQEGNNFGYLDTNTDAIYTQSYPEDLLHTFDFETPNLHWLHAVAISPTGSQITFFNFAFNGNDPSELPQVMAIDLAPPVTPPTFTDGHAGNITTTADTPISLSASFTASAPNGAYTASISWGDTTTTDGVTVTPGTGNTFTISYTGKTFSTPGTYSGLITVSDLGNGGGTIGFTTTVSALFVGSATNISGDEDTPLSLSANFTASAPAGGVYLAAVHWGDGSPDSPATVTSLGNDQYTISYSGKVFANAGTNSGTITVSDAAQGGGVIPFSSTISAILFSGASGGISGAEGVAQTLAGMFTAALPVNGQYTATINWGNSTPASTGTVVSLGDNDYAVVYQGKVFNVQGTFNGSIVIKDGNATAGTILFNSVITDTPLVVNTPTLVNSNGKFFNLSANFSDDIDSTTSWFTATVTWGDGGTSAGTVVADTAHPGHYVVLATHKFRKGTFNIALTVSSHDEANLVTSVAAATSLTVS